MEDEGLQLFQEFGWIFPGLGKSREKGGRASPKFRFGSWTLDKMSTCASFFGVSFSSAPPRVSFSSASVTLVQVAVFPGHPAPTRYGHGAYPMLHFRVDEHPFATYFDVHQGYRVLTHSHISLSIIKALKHMVPVGTAPRVSPLAQTSIWCEMMSLIRKV